MIKFKTKSGQWEITNPTIGQYYKMQDWLILSDKTDVQVKLVSILSGAPEEDLRSMDTDSFIKVWNQTALGPLNSLADKSFQKEIEIDDTKYGFITMSKLTVGELADMDVLKNHEQVSKQLHKMMAIMYRPLNADGTVSEYTSDNFDERAELFLNKMPISYVTTAIDFFFSYYQSLLKQYVGLFDPDDDGDDAGSDGESTGRRDIKIARNWNQLIYFLAGDDLLRTDS